MKRFLVFIIALMLLLPTLAEAKGGSFSGGRSSSFSSSRSTISLSKSSSTYHSSRTYSSRTYVSHNTTVVHHYHYYEPSPFHYYSGFTTGMMLGSLMHPQGNVYVVNGQTQQYGPSPIAEVVDSILVILILSAIVFFIIRMRKRRI